MSKLLSCFCLLPGLPCFLPSVARAAEGSHLVLFSQAEVVEWTMTDAVLVVALLLVALTAVCKSSQRH